MTITNDGATILKLLEVEHPAAKVLCELADLQDKEVGDGTTSVVRSALRVWDTPTQWTGVWDGWSLCISPVLVPPPVSNQWVWLCKQDRGSVSESEGAAASPAVSI